MEDDDDIEWPENPFDRPYRAEPESPDELLALIQFEGTPVSGIHRYIHKKNLGKTRSKNCCGFKTFVRLF
jgi:hypothetical protein